MLTRTFHQGPGLGCQGPEQGLHSQGPGQGPGFEYKDQDKDLSKCGHISVNIPANFDNTVFHSTNEMEVILKCDEMGTYHRQLRPMSSK